MRISQRGQRPPLAVFFQIELPIVGAFTHVVQGYSGHRLRLYQFPSLLGRDGKNQLEVFSVSKGMFQR